MSQTYIVSGASRGLGLEFVKQLSSKGHIVIATARNPQGSEKLAALIDNKQVFGVPLDTTNLSSVKVSEKKKKKKKNEFQRRISIYGLTFLCDMIDRLPLKKSKLLLPKVWMFLSTILAFPVNLV
jgi:hypothetical protein